MKIRLYIHAAFLLLFSLAPLSASAQETQPNDPCTVGEQGYTRLAAAIDSNDGGNFLFCNGSQWVGFLNFQSTGNLVLGTTGALRLPVGDTADRPINPIYEGMIRYNSALDIFEGYVDDGTPAWESLLGGGSGNLWTDNTTHISYQSAHIIKSGQPLPAGLDADGKRMFFYPDKSALRGGEITLTNDAWQNANIGANSFSWGLSAQASGYASTAIGQTTTASGLRSMAMGLSSIASGGHSIAMGVLATASGDKSTAIGNEVRTGDGTAGNGKGDYSVAFGLGDTAGGYPQLTGQNAAGFFMGAQNNVVFASSNTFGVFGGRMVIDPADPATQLTARGVLDLGAATDALVLPAGTTAQEPNPANGMIRYDTTMNKFRGVVSGAWADLGGGSSVWTAGAGDDIYYNSGIHMVGIGITNPDVELDVDGDIEYTGSITDMSDRRLKTDISDLAQGQLSHVIALNGVSFKMADDSENSTELGFIAQDVQKIYPNLVHERSDGMLSLNYIGLIAPMAEAIEEQQALIDALRFRIETLEGAVKDQ